jgi:hypothetical protein
LRNRILVFLIIYSEIKFLKFKGEYPTDVVLYPNPSKSHINILLPDHADIDLAVVIYSIQGVIIENNVLEKGEKEMNLDISKLQPGQYFMKIGSAVRRFVVVE